MPLHRRERLRQVRHRATQAIDRPTLCVSGTHVYYWVQPGRKYGTDGCQLCGMNAVGGGPVNLFAQIQALYQQGQRFVLRDIWLMEPGGITSTRRFLVRQLQVVIVVLRGFFLDHQCVLRASALTYTTLLALVPMLAFTFAFLKGLGVQNQLEPILIDKLAVGSEETVRVIVQYINNVRVGTLGVIGLGALLFSTLLQFSAVERSLNEIWGVREGRTVLRRLTDYISMMIIAPVMLLLAIAATATVKNQAMVATLLHMQFIGDAMLLGFTLLPYVAIWLAFTFFYMFIPNTQVHLFPALIGGFVGGMLWQLAQWSYITFQVGMAKYQAIYGAFAQLPVLMIWLYISWTIVLLGAEVAFACQYAGTYTFERFASATSFHVREWLASALYFSLVQAYTEGQGPWSAEHFAQQHQVPIRLLREILDVLVQERLLIEDATTPEHYVPGRHPDAITPWHILYALRHHGKHAIDDVLACRESCATALMAQVEAATEQVAGARNMVQWLAESSAIDPAVEGRST